MGRLSDSKHTLSNLFRSSLWPLVVGFAMLAVPTLVNLGRQTWSHEDGVQGPIVLTLGIWLLARELPTLNRAKASGGTAVTVLLIILALPFYVFGRAFDIITFEAGGLYAISVALLYAHFGGRALIAAWFPIFYLFFVVPPPSYLIDQGTAPLKHFAALVSTGALQTFGVPVSRDGVTMLIGPYQLLVENACSGMNSLLGLSATSLLYIYLMRRASLGYSLFLAGFAIPIAIAANIIRIMIIVLITWIWGDEVGQSFIHQAAGLVLFGTALALLIGADHLLFPILHRRKSGI